MPPCHQLTVQVPADAGRANTSSRLDERRRDDVFQQTATRYVRACTDVVELLPS
jgi:hypothetical protein